LRQAPRAPLAKHWRRSPLRESHAMTAFAADTTELPHNDDLLRRLREAGL
jgi:hypothetical protein